MKQSPKGDSGFVKLRRGLRSHLAEMSGNGLKLFSELLFRADWGPGPKRGWVETTYEDLTNSLGWSLKTLQRAVEGLTEKPYTEVERAANQYELTRIKIFKYDVEEFASGLDKSVHSAVHSTTPISQSHDDLRAPCLPSCCCFYGGRPGLQC